MSNWTVGLIAYAGFVTLLAVGVWWQHGHLSQELLYHRFDTDRAHRALAELGAELVRVRADRDRWRDMVDDHCPDALTAAEEAEWDGLVDRLTGGDESWTH